MKFYIVTLLSLVFAASVSTAADLRCDIADESNQNVKKIVPTITTGALVVEAKEYDYQGHTVSILFNKGDEFEPQTILRMTVDGVTSQAYDVSKRTLYQQLGKGYFLQCWFE